MGGSPAGDLAKEKPWQRKLVHLFSGSMGSTMRSMPVESTTIRGFAIRPAQRADLVTFLQSLTDNALLDDSRFTNPWSNSPTTRAR